MKYKVGDRVRIKSLDWYNDNRDRIDEVVCGNTNFIPDMVKYCEEIVTISSVLPTLEVYHIKEDGGMFNWTDEMIEGIMEEETYDFLKTDKPNRPSLNDFMDMLNNEIKLPQGYQFVDENGNVINATKIVLEKKETEYPKTYEECCKVMNYCCNPVATKTTHKEELIRRFQFLLLYRDAYWKIYGEEMGLDKPWEPDWTKADERKYCIVNTEGNITKWVQKTTNKILAFPTPEMRDAFYENFKELIESVKELL